MDNLLRAFIIGSSLPATIYTLGYMGHAYNKNPIPQIDYAMFAIIMPLVFGISNAILSGLIRYQNTRVKFLIFGFIFGFIISSIGLYMDLPVQLFEIPENKKYIVLLLAPILYAFIWAVPIYGINKFMFDIN